MATNQEKATNETVSKAVNELIMKEENTGFLKGELKVFIEMLSEKYGVSHYTLKNRYYGEVKGKVKQSNVAKKRIANTTVVTKPKAVAKRKEEIKVINLDESIAKHIEKEPVDKMFKYPKDYYHVGQMVDVKVLNLQTYGAFCEIQDGRGFQALCHISEITTNGRIKNVREYMDINDVIAKAKIILIEDKRINLTVKHLNLPKREIVEMNFDNGEIKIPENPPITLGEKFGNLKEQLMAKAVEPKAIVPTKEITTSTLQLDTSEIEIDEIFAIENESVKQEIIVQKYSRDIEEMTHYLSSQLGALSTQAKVELAKIIEKEGVFKTTRSLMKTQDDFKADLGLLFVQQMRDKMNEYL